MKTNSIPTLAMTSVATLGLGIDAERVCQKAHKLATRWASEKLNLSLESVRGKVGRKSLDLAGSGKDKVSIDARCAEYDYILWIGHVSAIQNDFGASVNVSVPESVSNWMRSFVRELTSTGVNA